MASIAGKAFPYFMNDHLFDPFALFSEWYDVACGRHFRIAHGWSWLCINIVKMASGLGATLLKNPEIREVFLPSSMCLSTLTEAGEPNARIVIMKGLSENRFTFYTHYESQKALELAKDNHVHLNFHWRMPPRQIRISGRTTKMSREQSQRYWETRPRASQISAAVSPQSQTIDSLAELEKSRHQYSIKMQGKPIPCPENWGGYFVTPHRFEFWEGRLGRLHFRQVFDRVENGWTSRLLAP
jgi:pyridoxamine 5'-phosphate oxidase